MADLAVTILQVVAEIRNVAKEINQNDRQALRLSKRVTAIEPAVLAVKHGKKRLLSSVALSQLLETVERIRNFLHGYARTTKLTRAWKRKSTAASFAELGDTFRRGGRRFSWMLSWTHGRKKMHRTAWKTSKT